MKEYGKISRIKLQELNPVQTKIKKFHFYRSKIKIKY